MTVRAQIIIITVLVFGLIGIVYMVKQRSLELKYCLIWILCDILLMLFVVFPAMMNSMARALGIYTPVNMVFFLGFVFSLVIVFSLTVALSRVTARVRKLAQMIALYEDSNDESDGTNK